MFNPEKKNSKDTHSLLNENNPTKSTLDILMINNTTHMFSLSWWGYYFKQRDMLSPSKMITYHFQGWIQKFSGVEGVNTHFNSTHPTPKISTKIFQIKSGHSRMQFDFLRLYTFFSYVYFWIFIYFLREKENDFLQIRVLWKLVNWLQMSPKPVYNLVQCTCLSY